MPIDSETHLGESGQRFDVELFIVHPTIDPSEITIALGLEPKVSHRAGDRRVTPKGILLEGNHDRVPAGGVRAAVMA
jgi:hypothetical protein